MENVIDWVRHYLTQQGLPEESAAIGAATVGIVLLVGLAWIANFLAKRVILRLVMGVVSRTRFTWDDAMLRAGVFTRLSHLAPALVFTHFGPALLGGSPAVLAGVRSGVSLYLVAIWLSVLFALLNAFQALAEQHGRLKGVPIKGLFQALKLVAVLLAVIFALAILLGRSPLYLLSGLGALTAVLLLVFRDAILGFVAGIMISANELVRVGDWIEMPKAGADGDVIDVTLTTVKVRNWDKTITTIPTYNLISDSFKNWRGMKETGGRRIKRALYLDMQSIRFADEAMLERWKQLRRLRGYLDAKLAEIAQENQQLGQAASVLGNGRRLTNIGTFRAYCIAYLREHPMIHQELTFLVRQLQPTAQGLPLEIYVFVNDTNWAVYEGVQADIFDHLLSIVGVFDLRVYQQPSGYDVRETGLRGAAAAVALTDSAADAAP